MLNSHTPHYILHTFLTSLTLHLSDKPWNVRVHWSTIAYKHCKDRFRILAPLKRFFPEDIWLAQARSKSGRCRERWATWLSSASSALWSGLRQQNLDKSSVGLVDFVDRHSRRRKRGRVCHLSLSIDILDVENRENRDMEPNHIMSTNLFILEQKTCANFRKIRRVRKKRRK